MRNGKELGIGNAEWGSVNAEVGKWNVEEWKDK
jgi:hypothetical protein